MITDVKDTKHASSQAYPGDNNAPRKRGSSVLIVGVSRLAQSLGRRFVHAGHLVTLVGRYASDRWHIPTDCYTTMVIGEARNPQTLERAGIQAAWAVLAVTEEDNVNLPVALAAKQNYDVPVVLAFVTEETRSHDY